MADLTATKAVEAMRNGDMKAEDYAKALLDRTHRICRAGFFMTYAEPPAR
jgi:hypothetical protein